MGTYSIVTLHYRSEPTKLSVHSSFALIPVKTDSGWVWLSRVYWVYTVTNIFDRPMNFMYNRYNGTVVKRDYDTYSVKKHDYLVMKLSGELDGKF